MSGLPTLEAASLTLLIGGGATAAGRLGVQTPTCVHPPRPVE